MEQVDPPRCAVCGDPLPRKAIVHADCYCSTNCAKRAHGIMVKDGLMYAHVVPIGSRREPPR